MAGLGRRPLLTLAAALALAALLPVPVLELRPAAGGAGPSLVRPAYPGFRFALTYTHSIYGAPVAEQFQVSPGGLLVLREITSPDPRIEGYYDIPGARAIPGAPGIRLSDLNLPHRELRLRATRIGRRTYADSRFRVLLADLAGDWGTVTLAVRWRPLAAYLWQGRRSDCSQPMSSTPWTPDVFRRLSKSTRAPPGSSAARSGI